MSKNKIINIILYLCVAIALITKVLGFDLFSRIASGIMSVFILYNIIFCYDSTTKKGILIYLSIILIPTLFLIFCLIFQRNNIALLRISGYIFITSVFIAIGVACYIGMKKNKQ